MDKPKYQILNGFYLRLIAILSVLVDHVALLFINPTTDLYSIMRIFGRLAFVLFAFFLSEGVIYSKNKDKYLMRFGILYLVIQIYIMALYLYEPSFMFPNIFATLLGCGSALVYLEKKEWKKVYYLIPFVLLLTVNIMYIVNQNTFVSLFRGDYLIYGMIVIFGFYFARKLGSLYLKRIATVNSSNATINPQLVYNLSASAVFLIIHLVYHVLNNSFILSINFALQSFSLMLIPLLMLYNGTRGYSGLGWRISYYLFFPVHLLLLALIFLLGLYF